MIAGGKGGLVLLYLGLVGTVCLWPFLLQARSPRGTGAVLPVLLCGALAAGAAALLAARGLAGPLAPLVLALAFHLPWLGAGLPALLSGLAALVLLAGATWWQPAMQLEPARAAIFVAAGLAASLAARLLTRPAGLPAWPVLLALAAAGLLASLWTGPFAAPMASWALWHHWGAFVAPAEALLGGGVPFRDFPVQYGMGPTLLIASLCGTDCWAGTYWAVVATNMAYLLALAACVLLLTREAPRGVALLAVTALAASMLLWSGYPPDLMGWITAPSVAGMRFMPLALLLLVILRAEAAGTRRDGLGHALWLFGLAWSPESGFFVSLVWWPSLALRRAQLRNGGWPVAQALLTGALRAVLALCAAVLGLVLLFRIAFGDWPSLWGFLAHARNPPGLQHPNLLGPVWLIPAAIAVGLVAMARADARRVRTIFACLAALAGVTSYYLGRSHDNNVLNLFPFLVLAVVAATATGAAGAPLGFARMVMAGLVAWVASFGFEAWGDAWREGPRAGLGPARLLAQMDLQEPEAQRLLDRWSAVMGAGSPPAADAAAALRVAGEEGGAPVLLDALMLLPRSRAGGAWTGMNNLGNFGSLPLPAVEHFIRRGAEAYRRPGWLVIDRRQMGSWLDLFRTAYDVAEERSFGGYAAYRLVPR